MRKRFSLLPVSAMELLLILDIQSNQVIAKKLRKKVIEISFPDARYVI